MKPTETNYQSGNIRYGKKTTNQQIHLHQIRMKQFQVARTPRSQSFEEQKYRVSSVASEDCEVLDKETEVKINCILESKVLKKYNSSEKDPAFLQEP